jgi:non-specific serine/threonine protein kinase
MVAGLRREFDRAARLVGAAEALYEADGVRLPPPDRPTYASTRAAVVANLGPYAEMFLREGADTSLAASIALAETVIADIQATQRTLLSAREIEVLGLIARGMSDREIAQTLGISVRTAEDHAQTIRDKLGVRSRVKAVAEAKLLGLI